MNYLDGAKKGYKLIKTATESYKVVKAVKEKVQNIDKTITEIEETITKSKNVVSKANSFLHRKNKKKNEHDIIEKPITDNKVEIYEWMYNESEKIKELFIKNLSELCNKKEIPNIYFWEEESEDKLFFSVDYLSNWKRFNDRLKIETFTLKPRLEKLNDYNFDEQDIKRINDSKELVNRLNEPKSNLELAQIFRDTDKLLAAYYYRESLNVLLSKFLRTKTLEEMTPEEIEDRRVRLEKEKKQVREERLKKVMEELITHVRMR
ncbi:hypothetical protein [Neobacillus jeddahensis]|uniref:hypothetical protein n=1 Tax=Neobacillus jeddahensis TaxID=1461580 RepID=UPI00058E5BEF|nr:hypothetical protein [Neobacillus jeddahensis]